jgi:hypothetical protein
MLACDLPFSGCYDCKRFPLDQEWEITPRPFRADEFLLLVDLRSGLGDAAFYEISLNLELLLRA